MPIISKSGQLTKNGDRLDFSIVAQLMGSGVTGESALIGSEETMSVGTFSVTADYIRHAVALTKKANRQANFELVGTAKELLSGWWSRRSDSDIFNCILDGVATDQILFANGATSESDLSATDGDTFGPAEIDLVRMALLRQGALPIQAKKTNGRTVPIYGMVIGEVEEYRLNQNTSFVQSIRETWNRFSEGQTHPMYKGAIGMFKNMVIYPYYSTLGIPQGTPLRPETTVYVSLITAATCVCVGGASGTGSTGNYTAFFASSGSLQIEDEILSYASKTVNAFVGLTRGVSSTSAAYHSQYKLVTQRNVAKVIGFGAEAVCRALGDSPKPIGENRDYGMAIGLGIETYVGQALTKDKRRGKARGVVVVKCISVNPGTI